jgi:RNA recognition motif-containing protein
MAPYEPYSHDFSPAPGIDISIPLRLDRMDRGYTHNLYSSHHQLFRNSSSDINNNNLVERKRDVSFSGPTYAFARPGAFINGSGGDYGLGGSGDDTFGGAQMEKGHPTNTNSTSLPLSSSNLNHPHPMSQALPTASNSIYSSDQSFPRSPNPSETITVAAKPSNFSTTSSMLPTHPMLYWGDLEPWMDEEYINQACKLMGWNPIAIKIPHPSPDASVPVNQQGNNLGYCFLIFSSSSQANAVLKQLGANPDSPVLMPNSSKPLKMKWASSVMSSQLATAYPSESYQLALPSSQHQAQTNAVTQQNHNHPQNSSHQHQKEYSIFVGDLAPETSNSDLVAVFRNPVLGLRNDREPKFIKPFLSCKSAKIMLDQATGVSRGYGFVRYVISPLILFLDFIVSYKVHG